MGECIYISIDIGANPTQAVTHTLTHTHWGRARSAQ